MTDRSPRPSTRTPTTSALQIRRSVSLGKFNAQRARARVSTRAIFVSLDQRSLLWDPIQNSQMRRFYIVIIIVGAYGLVAPSIKATAAEKPSFPDATKKPEPNTQPVPVPYPISPVGPPHGPRSEPKYLLPLPTIQHSGTATKSTTKYIDTEKNKHRK